MGESYLQRAVILLNIKPFTFYVPCFLNVQIKSDEMFQIHVAFTNSIIELENERIKRFLVISVIGPSDLRAKANLTFRAYLNFKMDTLSLIDIGDSSLNKKRNMAAAESSYDTLVDSKQSLDSTVASPPILFHQVFGLGKITLNSTHVWS